LPLGDALVQLLLPLDPVSRLAVRGTTGRMLDGAAWQCYPGGVCKHLL